MDDDAAADGLRRLRQMIDGHQSAREQRRRKSPNGFWHDELTRFNSPRVPEHGALEFAGTCAECGLAILHGTELSVPPMVLLTTVMGKRLLRSEEILSRVSEICRSRLNEFTPGERAAQTRSYANLRHGNDPLIDAHVSTLLEDSDWLFDDLIALLWALMLAGRDVPTLVGQDALMRLGRGGHGQFHRYRDLSQLCLMYDLEVPSDIAARASNFKGPKHKPLEGSQSPLEEQVAEALVALGLRFSQQASIGGYSADFAIEMSGERFILEATGLFVHYLSDLRPILKGSQSPHRQLLTLSDDLRGEDGLRARIFRKLGYKVVFVKGADVPHRLGEQTETILNKLRGAV